MSDPNNEEKITEKDVLDYKTQTGKTIYTIKCKECGEEFTDEQVWSFGSQPWPAKEWHSRLRAELRDHKEKVHQIFEEGRTCNKCKTPLFDYSGEQFSWYTNKKHGNVCKNCLDELDKQGELWDNFFKIRTYKCAPGYSDPGMENGSICNFCHNLMLDRQIHQKENDKWVPKHNCLEWEVKHGKGNREREREREREISQLRSRIAELEAIANRTAEQERELQDKKRELERLEQQQSGGGDPKKPTNYLPWIIGGILLVGVIVLIIYFTTRKKNE